MFCTTQSCQGLCRLSGHLCCCVRPQQITCALWLSPNPFLKLLSMKFPSTDQVLNLVPWGGVALRLPPVALADAEGAKEVSRRIADAYISDIVMHQVATTALKPLTLKAPHVRGC